jgi:hypothetical protein
MKFITYYALLVTCLIFPMFGKAVTGPKLVCDTPVYNFGQVDQSAIVTNIFMVRNDGNVTFVAGIPRTTCSCTKASINKRMIGPGETAEVTAVFTAARRKGEQHKTIYLLPSDSEIPVIKLYMQGFVESPAL